METTTAFDLNLAIRRWRENLEQSPALNCGNLNEMESHLRDSVATLQTRELSAEESFLVATHRLGKSGLLEQEFAKVNVRTVWLDRVMWALILMQCWWIVSGLFSAIGRGLVYFGLTKYNFIAQGRVVPTTLFVMAQLLAFVGSLAFCWWLIVRQEKSLRGWAGRALQQERIWVLAAIGSCGLNIPSFLMSYGTTLLYLKNTDVAKCANIAVSQSFSTLIVHTIQTITLVTLALLLARRRHWLSRA